MDVRQLTSEQREELFEDLLALKDAVPIEDLLALKDAVPIEESSPPEEEEDFA